MAQELKAYNVVATVDVNPDVVDYLGCTEYAAYDADEADAVLAEKDAEIRRLKRALYKACANWAHEKDDRYYLKYVCISDDARIQYERWRKMERKCRAKAEEIQVKEYDNGLG